MQRPKPTEPLLPCSSTVGSTRWTTHDRGTLSDLTMVEKRVLEEALQMGGGYVLDFSDRTFNEFVSEATGIDIDEEKYRHLGTSKANRLRTFWRIEPNHVVGQLIAAAAQYAEAIGRPTDAVAGCHRVAERLRMSAPVPELAAISPNATGREFEILARSLREAIERNEPEGALDRLHTFVVRYVRVLAAREGVTVDDTKPLHSLFGELVRALRARGVIESEMTERILKSSISTLESFNHVRNDRSFAHDNPLLSYAEALLIFNNVSASIRFLSSLPGITHTEAAAEVDSGDFPF